MPFDQAMRVALTFEEPEILLTLLAAAAPANLARTVDHA